MMSALRIANVPVLIAKPLQQNATLPTVLWFHGFRADALAHAAELERCTAAGFLAVGVDAAGHGARRDEYLSARIAASPGGARDVMYELVEATVKELPPLIEQLVAHHGADASRVSAVGISMGAFLVYRAIADGISFRSAVALLGSPSLAEMADAPAFYRRARRVALLSITAEFDVSVPPEATIAMHQQLMSMSLSRNEKHQPPAIAQHRTLQGAGHLTTAAQWSEAIQYTVEWLGDHGQ